MRFKVKCKNSSSWNFYESDQLPDTFKSDELPETLSLEVSEGLYDNDLIHCSDGEYLIVGHNRFGMLKDSVKTIPDEEFLAGNYENEKGFIMFLDEFLKYNDYQIVGNKFDKYQGRS